MKDLFQKHYKDFTDNKFLNSSFINVMSYICKKKCCITNII